MLQVSEQDSLLITGGRVIDPTAGRDEITDIAVVDGFVACRPGPSPTIINAAGWIVCPALMDIHVHLREPGQTHKETIRSGTAAAAAGGFGFVACMPNTSPAIDQPETVRFVIEQARLADFCDVAPIAAITQNRAGLKLTDMAALVEAGAVAFSDDGTGVEDDAVMRAAFEQIRRLDTVLIQHCEFQSISAGGVMHLGETSRRLGLPGLDPRSEEVMIERDIDLAAQTEARYHVAHVSTARSVELVRQAKAKGVRVTAEVCPHHLLMTERACEELDPNTKVHPPLRTSDDVEACRQGLKDGTIDCVVTDHAPHTQQEKGRGFLKAPPGIAGLETAVALTARAMIENGHADWPRLIDWLTSSPARVLGIKPTSIQEGSRARLSIIDPAVRWRVDPTQFESKGRNTPFAGWELTGRPLATIRENRLTAAALPITQHRQVR